MPEQNKKNLKQFKMAADFLEQVFNSASEGILLINPWTYKIVTFNQSVLDKLELSEAELLGARCHKLFYKSDVPCNMPFHICPVKQILKTKKHLMAEYLYISPEQNEKLFEVSVNIVPPSRETNLQIAYVLREIDPANTPPKRQSHQFYIDRLTKLYNNNFFEKQLNTEINRAKRYNRPLVLMVLSLDNPAAYEDLSMAEKSDFLSMLGGAINDSIRTTDSGYNYGNHNFYIILPETPLNNVLILAKRIKAIYKNNLLQLNLGQVGSLPRLDRFSISLGIAGFKNQDNVQTLITNSLTALTEAQKNGGDAVIIYQHPPAAE